MGKVRPKALEAGATFHGSIACHPWQALLRLQAFGRTFTVNSALSMLGKWANARAKV